MMAAVLGPHDADHLDLRRDHVDPLRTVLADAHQRMTACTLLVLLCEVDQSLHPRQPLWQWFPFRPPARFRRLGGLILCRLLFFGFVLDAAFDLVKQPQLLALGVAELLGAAPVQLVL